MLSVTVIIPYHNAGSYLEETVRSCLQQEGVTEILLVNDHSTDNSLETAERLAMRHSIIRLLELPGDAPLGPGAARNLGIKHSQAEFVAFLDADDIYEPNRFSAGLAFLVQHPEADGFFEPTIVYDATFSKVLQRKGMFNSVAPENLFKELLLGRSGHFNVPGIILRKSAFRKAGLFNEALRWHQDTELWLRIAFHARLFGNPTARPVAKIRQHAKNHSKKANSKTRQLHWISVLNYFKNQPIGAYSWYIMLLRLGVECFHPPSKFKHLALPLLIFRYPAYYWIWLKKWLREG